MEAIEFPARKAQYGIVSGRQGPRGRKNKMKTTILTFALALATIPLTFAAAQTPAPAATGAAAKTAATATAKTHRKHHKKGVKNTVQTPAASTVPAGLFAWRGTSCKRRPRQLTASLPAKSPVRAYPGPKRILS